MDKIGSSSSVTPRVDTPVTGRGWAISKFFRQAANSPEQMSSLGVGATNFPTQDNKVALMKIELQLFFGGHVKSNFGILEKFNYIIEQGVEIKDVIPPEAKGVRRDVVQEIFTELGREYFHRYFSCEKLQGLFLNVVKPLKELGWFSGDMYAALADFNKLQELKVGETYREGQFLTDKQKYSSAYYNALDIYMKSFVETVPARSPYPLVKNHPKISVKGPSAKETRQKDITADLDSLRLELTRENAEVNTLMIKGARSIEERKLISDKIYKMHDLLEKVNNFYTVIFKSVEGKAALNNARISLCSVIEREKYERIYVDYNFRLPVYSLEKKSKINYKGVNYTLLSLLELRGFKMSSSLIRSIDNLDNALKNMFLMT